MLFCLNLLPRNLLCWACRPTEGRAPRRVWHQLSCQPDDHCNHCDVYKTQASLADAEREAAVRIAQIEEQRVDLSKALVRMMQAASPV
jgi:hypothetical protein